MSESDKFSKVLLIIDSSVFIIERLVNMLEEVKNIKKVITATDYEAALEILYKEHTDVVLLDIQMPEKNGIDLLKHIVYHFPETRVIVLSNLVSDFYQKLCMAEGAVHFVDKTKDFDKIPELILAL